MTNQTIKSHTNKELTALTKGYHTEIPLSEIFAIVHRNIGEILDIDGTPWAGFLCGSEGHVNFKIQNFRASLTVDWFTMQSGKYEVVAYVS